jgi:signal transduction histidine kinase
MPNPVGEGIPTLRKDLVHSVWPRGGTVVVGEDDGWHEQLPYSRDLLRKEMAAVGASRCVVAPIGVGAEMLGYLGVGFAPDHGDLRQPELDAVLEISRELGRMVHSARLFETEQRLVSELRELDRYKGELIATISHELKTPLTSIIGHVELLQDIYSEVGSIEAISRNAQRLNRLINNLLNYSRVQEQRNSLRRPVDLAALCEATVELVAFQAERAGVDLELIPAEDRVEVHGDPDELARVLDNVIGNAVKYTPAGGRVRVRVGQQDGTAEVRVEDTGIGISTQDQVHLFSAFHRSSNPDAQSIPGTGLGLAISRRIIELHAGEITVASQLGEGSVFTVRLPGPA